MTTDKVIRKLERRAQAKRHETLSMLHFLGATREDEDDEVTVVDPETNTRLTFMLAHEGAFGRIRI